MPFKCPDHQKRYTWNLSPDGLPVGDVQHIGGIPYLLVCPLCGMLHQIMGGSALTIGAYEPTCIVKQTHKTVYAAWIAQYPEATQYTRVSLYQRVPNVIPLDSDSNPQIARRTRKAA